MKCVLSSITIILTILISFYSAISISYSENVKVQVINNVGDTKEIKLYVSVDAEPIGNPNGISFREAVPVFTFNNKVQTAEVTYLFSGYETLNPLPSASGVAYVFNGIDTNHIVIIVKDTIKDTIRFYNPYNRELYFSSSSNNIPDASIQPGKVPITFIHGVTDAPAVNLKDNSTGAALAAGVDYKKWAADYIYLEPKSYEIKVTTFSKDSTIDIFKVDLTGYANKPLIFFTSGFMYPEKNFNGLDFALCAASADGKVITFLSTNPKPQIPVLVSPVNMAVNQPISGKLRWMKTIAAKSYHLQISKDSTFATSVVNQDNFNDTAYTYNNLEYVSRYFWRVRGKKDNIYGRWSPVWSFSTLAPPPRITLIYPQINAKDMPTSDTLIWKREPLADKYHLQVATDILYSNIILNIDTLKDTTYILNNLEKNVIYYWQVAGINIAGKGAFSGRSFQTAKDTNKPDIVKLQFPLDDMGEQDTSGTLRWHDVPKTDTFQIQISLTDDFNKTVADTTVSDTTYNYSGLRYDTEYYWRVRGINENGIGIWPFPWSFKTKLFVSVEEEFSAGDKILFMPNPVGNELHLDKTLQTQNREIIIYSIEGLKQFEGEAKAQIDVSRLAPGVYFLKSLNKYYKFVKSK